MIFTSMHKMYCPILMYVLFQKVTSSKERVDNGFKDWDKDQDEDRIERLHLVWLKNELAQPSIHTSGL